MTAEEVSRRYGIPSKILAEYRSWGLCGAVQMAMEDWQYNDLDLERLGTIMALHDMGFKKDEVEQYMKLLIKGESTNTERLKMLDKQRSETLSEIHLKEKQLERMDYLRTEIRSGNSRDD
ncbi:MAG: MerR family transcriptional regulator [Clostridiales bacterium]|nr:MerR family transcriptional regulator [Clostridiales bacterium]